MKPKPFISYLKPLRQLSREEFVREYGECFLIVTSRVDTAAPVAFTDTIGFEPIDESAAEHAEHAEHADEDTPADAPPETSGIFRRPMFDEPTAVSDRDQFLCFPIQMSEGEELTIGRKEDGVDLELVDGSVSQHHATFRMVDGIIHLIDADSSNGTYVDEWPVTDEARPLSDTHAIRMGSVSFLYAASEPFWRFAASITNG